MKPRVVLASAAIHLGFVAVAVLVITGAPAEHRSLVDIEIAPAVVTTEPLRERRRDTPGEQADPAPVRRAEPARKAQRRAPPPPAAPRASTPPAPEVELTAAPAGDGSDVTASGETEGSGTGGAGAGTGLGDGDGAGAAAIDRSAPAVPLDPDLSQTLPYTAEAARGRVSGDVHLVLVVDPLGHVGQVTVRRGLGHGLDEIAVAQARKIRFRPARDRAGSATVGKVRWRYHFEPP